MEPTTLAIAATGLFLAGIIKGATGLGYASCALPFLVLAIGLKPAMALVLAPAIATNISLVITTGHLRWTAEKFHHMYIAMVPGIGAGLMALLWVDQSVATKVLGIVLLCYVALGLARPAFALAENLHGPLQIPAGFLNGFFTGLTGSQVVPLLPYVMSLQLDPNRTVQVINVGVIVSTAVLSVGLYAAGILTLQLAGGSLAAIVPALIGTSIGVRLRQAISVAGFRKLVLLTLLAIGLLMILR
ncbi:MAG: sulfite exporter TauE/SafE family protein [Alphaproteobacteria bacterium]|nr:sulfite exporter TauE/SafE family protein [Alphaproteobacteria bacterium]